MTVEEIEILVTAKIENALKEVEKLSPAIKKQIKYAQESFSKIDTKAMTNKLNQAINFVKKKMQDFRKSNTNNQIAIKVNNKDAQKNVSQIQKQIESLQKQISARQLKLNLITPRLDEITAKTTRTVTPDGLSSDNPAIQNTINNSLNSNKEYTNLLAQENKMTQEIAMYNKQLDIAKSKMTQLGQQISQTGTAQNRLSSFFNAFKAKMEQVKPSVSNLKNSFSQMPKITQKMTSHIKGMGTGIKQGVGHVLKYAGALFSLRGIYSVLSNAASAWLSSQDEGAKQLSANIDYMKYAMGSALAPVIQFVTNLVYQLMKAIQSVAYTLTGVNIFANASAKSYAGMAGNAKKAKQETKQLAGIHDEINNIQNNDNTDSGSGTTTPSLDLSGLDNTPNSIIDAIKKGNWHEVGATIGEKLNDAMNSIPWEKIQENARKISRGIADFLNGFIASTDWNQVGNTFAQGLNTIIYFGYEFVTTFDWGQFGKAIGDSINGFFTNIDWATAGKALSNGIRGILDTISAAISEIDWWSIGESIWNFLINIDWSGIVTDLANIIGKALGALSQLLAGFLIDAVRGIGDFFNGEIEECGGNVVLGILKGIGDAVIGIGQWLWDNVVKPLIDGFCELLGIHSPSTVFAEFGQNIIQGLFDGISSLVNSIKEIWENIKNTATEIFLNIKESIVNKVSEIKNEISQKFQDAYNSIKNIFSNLGNFFSDVWRKCQKHFF